jgi:hypothetical protein
VARIKEAGRPALGRRPALEQRLGGGHRVAALLQRLGNRRQVLRALGAVEDLARTLVGLERLLVALLGLRRRVGHLDVHVECADILAEANEIVLRRDADLLPLALPACLVTEEGHGPQR